MKEDLMMLRMMPWKHKILLLGFCVLGIVTICIVQESLIIVIKSILLYYLLLVASYYDLKYRKIPNWIHFFLISAGLINVNVFRGLAGIIFSPLPFLIVALLQSGSIGGGDIKIIGSLGFAVGFIETIRVIILSLIFVTLYALIYNMVRDKKAIERVPLIPFIFVAWICYNLLNT